MNPQPKHQPLFFTPRTPWGTRLTGRSFYEHMHASEDAATRQMRASEEAEKAKSLYLNPGPDVNNPQGLYVKPEIDNKNADGKNGVTTDVGWSGPFSWEKKQEQNDKLNQQNKAWIKDQAAKAVQVDRTVQAAQQPQSGASGAGAGKTPPAMSPEEIDAYLKHGSKPYLDSDWTKPFLQGPAK